MLIPKRSSTERSRRANWAARPTAATSVSSASMGCRPWSRGWITARQIEAARVAMTRHIKRGGKIWIRIFPDKSDHEEARRNPHGKGKGRPGRVGRGGEARRVMYEMEGVTQDVAKEAFRLAANKLPIPTKFLTRDIFDED